MTDGAAIHSWLHIPQADRDAECRCRGGLASDGTSVGRATKCRARGVGPRGSGQQILAPLKAITSGPDTRLCHGGQKGTTEADISAVCLNDRPRGRGMRAERRSGAVPRPPTLGAC